MFFKKEIHWHKIFETLEAAKNRLAEGKVTTIQVENKNICLIHNSEGFFAVNDKCPHNGASLGNGFCAKDGSVVCPVHRYAFDPKTGRSKGGLGTYVHPYPIELRDDGMYIGFEKLVWKLF